MAYYLAEGAVLRGNITLAEDANVWYNATLRADQASVTIGKGTNIQDNAVIHESPAFPVVLGENVSVGHGAVLHGCTVGDNSLIGMGAVVLNGARIGKNCLIGAGALVPQNAVIPDGSLAFGNPAIIRRALTEAEIAANLRNAVSYVTHAKAALTPKAG